MVRRIFQSSIEKGPKASHLKNTILQNFEILISPNPAKLGSNGCLSIDVRRYIICLISYPYEKDMAVLSKDTRVMTV